MKTHLFCLVLIGVALSASSSGRCSGQIIGACCIPDQAAEMARCEDLGEADCQDVGGYFQEGVDCLTAECPLSACICRGGDCMSAAQGVCSAGPDAGQPCAPLLNNCRGICLGGPDDGRPCVFGCSAPGRCARFLCVGGTNNGHLCHPDVPDSCSGGACQTLLCRGTPGCCDPFCCTQVCLEVDVFCCFVHWDDFCAEQAASTCGALICGCIDNDGDGFGSLADPSCSQGPAVNNCDDCDDTRDGAFPGAAEILCNGVDDNCNGLADDDQNIDGDPVSLCGGDCDDTNDVVFPGAFEITCDGVDENCNGMADDDPNVDGDPVSLCAGDCDDEDPANFPGNTEVCDGQDNNCDGLVDAFRFGRWLVDCVLDGATTHVGATGAKPSLLSDEPKVASRPR